MPEATLGKQSIQLRSGASVYDTLDRRTGEIRRWDWNKKRRNPKTGRHEDYTILIQRERDKCKARRGTVRNLSGRARRRCIFALADMQPAHLLTLTFARIEDTRHCYSRLNAFLTWLRSIGIQRYVWVAEMQERGALHFHLIFEDEAAVQKLWEWKTVRFDHKEIRRPAVAFAWNRIVGGDLNHLKAGVRLERCKSEKGGRSYVSKYLSKGDDGKWEGRRWGGNIESRLVITNKSVVKKIFRICNRESRWTILGRNHESFNRIKSLIEQAGAWNERHKLDARHRGDGHRSCDRTHDEPDIESLEVGVQ